MIPDKEPVNNWNGNSSNVNFDFDFLINSEDELLVLHTDAAGIQTTLKLNIDYTINQTGNADGSYITFPILGSSYKTLGDDEKITLMLNIPIAQTSPYGTSAKLNLKSLEFSFDYIVRLIQMVNRKADRSVKVQEGSENTPDDLIESLNQAQINAENSANFAAQKAQEAGNSATKSEEQAEIATQKVVEIAELHETAIADITEKQSEAVLNIQQELQTAEDSIIESKNIALENIESTKTSSILEINNSANTTKTDILNQINSGKETAISEIQDVSDAEKVNLQSYVDKAKASENIATSKASEASTSAQKALTSENVCTAKEQSVIQKTTEALNSISSSQTTAVNAVNSAKTTAVNSVNLLVDKAQIWADGTDEEVQSIGGVHSAKGWAEYAKGQVSGVNQNLSNLSDGGEDRLNVSKMYETGAVSNDTKGFEELLKRAHSTFDKSKFTIQGSPTITDDGIASNFTRSNYAETIPVSKISLNTFMITCDFKWIANQGTIFSSARGGSTEYGIALIINGNKLGFYSSSNGTGWNVVNLKTGSTSLVSKNIYKVSVIFTGTQYICMLLNKNTGALTTEFTVDSTDKVFAGLNMINFGGNSYWQPLNGSIDLKSIAIWADGVPVFNGNKTGLYVAMPDNYKVVGSPTISDDGILTNCPSQNDYLSATIPSLSQFEKVRIEFELKVKEVPSSTRGIFNIPNDENPATANNGTYAWLSSNGFNINLAYNSGSDNGTASNNNCPVAVGDFIKVVAEGYKNSVGSFKVSKNNQAFSELPLTYANVCNFQEATKLFLGITGTGRQMQTVAEFDINSFKIYGDDNLIYQPCLKIPYTETFEHPNVVDVKYRNRVQDLYEQTGEALFYTLDEQNQDFTLPMGDIYGMITKNREILDIVYPIGRPMPEENNVLLDNEVWLEGATVNIVDYPKLFKVYGTKYGGNGTTTFKLPDMRGRTLWGSPDGSNGYIEAKLPNIKGAFFADCGGQGASANGAFAVDAGYTMHGRGTDNSPHATYSINASRSNSIYSDDATTVQPPAFKVRWKTRFE